MNGRIKRTAVLAITLMAVIAAGGLAAAQADEAESATAFDAGDYLKYIPELKPGNSVGGSLELDESDAYRFLKYYVDSFEGLGESTNRYNRMILDAAKASDTLDGFSSKICERVLSEYGKNAIVQASPAVTASIAFTIDISGTAEAPVAVIKVSGGVNASVVGSVTADGTTAYFDLKAEVPVSIYAEIALNSEKIPQSIDASVKFGVKTSGSVTADGETQDVGYDLDVEYILSAAVVNGISLNEVNTILNGIGSVTKELSMTFMVKVTEDGSYHMDGNAADVSLDLSKLGFDGLVSEADSKVKDSGVSTGAVKSLLKALKNGTLPDYADVKEIAELAHIDEVKYSQMKDIATPYLEQAKGILKNIRTYSANNDLASYYIVWNNSTVHGDSKDKIALKVVNAVKPQIEKPNLKDEAYTFYGTTDGVTVTGYERYSAGTAWNVTVPDAFGGAEVTGIGEYSFRVPTGTILNLSLPESIADVPRHIVSGGGACEGPGGSTIIMDNETKFGIEYELWMKGGVRYASAAGLYNGEATGTLALTIPEKIECGEKEYSVIEVGGEWGRGFEYCTEITSLNIPASVLDVTYAAFRGCTSLTEATIGTANVDLQSTFADCTALKKVTLEGTAVVLDGTFKGCTSLEELVLAEGVQLSIESSTFSRTSINPESVKSGSGTINLVDIAKNIDPSSFNATKYYGPGGGSTSDEGIYYLTFKVNGQYCSSVFAYYSDIESITVTAGGTVTSSGGIHYSRTVVGASIYDCSNLKTITLPGSITELNLSGLTSLESVKIVGTSDFAVKESGGYKLITKDKMLISCFGTGETFTLPKDISSCNWGALSSINASELVISENLSDSSISISKSVKKVTIGKDVAQLPRFDSNSIAEFAVAEENQHIKSIDGVLFTADGELLKYPAGKEAKSYIVPAKTKTINGSAFDGASLETITLNSDLQSIDRYSLYYCEGLKTVTIDKTDGNVRMESGFLISGSDILWYNGGSDIVIVPICDWINEHAFKAHTPKVIAFQSAMGSYVDIYGDSIVVTPYGNHIWANAGDDDEGPKVHIIRIGADSMSFSTDGTSLTCTAGDWWTFEPVSILVDGEKYVDGGTATFTVAQLSAISKIEPTYQPVKYTVVFVTSGGSPVPSQEVYFWYRADVPSDPYRSGFAFTGWYSDAGCTKAFDFDAPISMPLNSDSVVYVYAGWKVVQSPITPVVPDKPTIPDEPIINPDGSKTTEKVTESKDADGNDVKKVESETEYQDGSKVRSETVTTVKTDGSSKETITESSETVTDSSGSTVGFTTVSKVEKESDSGRSSVTSTVSKDGNGEETRTVTEVRIESKDSSVATSAEVVKERSGEEKIAIGTSITVESDSGDMTVSHEQMETAIGQAGEAMDAAGVSGRSDVSVTVEIKTGKFDDKRASVEMPAESFKAASESDVNLKLTSQVGSMVLDKGVSETLSSKGGSVSVSISVADSGSLNAEQRSRVGDAPLYSLKAMAGDESIHQLGGTVTVTVPYTLKEGDDPRSITVYYVNDQGVLSKKTTSYDPLTHSVTFVTDHFSYYMIAASADLADAHEDEGGSNVAVIAVAAVLAVIVIAAIAVVVKKR